MQPVAEAFGAALEQCVQDADPEAVHRVRTGSRRLQAMLECTLRESGPLPETFEKPARGWLRQLKKVRRAAGPVRDLDVQRKLLESWMEVHPLHDQANRLDAWLKDQRKGKAQDMQKRIGKRRPRLEEQQASLFAAFSALRLTHAAVRPADALAIDTFVRAADAMPRLDTENLHDLRKAAKKARYVAEAGSPKPTSVAKALKRIQDAIGEWHDWLCLEQDACEALGKDAPELTAALDHEVNRHFSSAIKITESMRGRLVGEWLAVKRPPASAGIANRRSA
jgi:CHAD domain-containing protein